MNHCVPPVLLAVFLLLSLALSVPAAPLSAQSGDSAGPGRRSAANPPSPGASQVINISFANDGQLAELTARLDVWEVHRDQSYVVAYVNASERAWLSDRGYQFEVDVLRSTNPDTIPGFPCYRTVTELYAQLDAWAAQYPQLVELRTIGYSYENRPLKVVRLTNKATGGSKPIFFVMANIHGRELITPETAMVFIQRLLQGYGTDPDITWMLDNHEAQVLVTANPDGHVKNEPGQPWAWWRKNTDPYGNCLPDSYGVDLNRNHTYMWNHGGSSSNPCDETYMGPSEGSEPELQAVQLYVSSIFPSRRTEGQPAPDDTMGTFLTLHSYAAQVLWPWGYTGTHAPNYAGLKLLGDKLATYNGYLSMQSIGLYPTSGTSDDWAYGILGVPAYTFEEWDGAGGGFYPACSDYDNIIQPNIPAMLYMLKDARTPYITTFGPDALGVTLTPTSTVAGIPVTVRATVDDTRNDPKTIVAAEAYVDTPPWSGGAPIGLSPLDGAWNQTVEIVQGTLQTTGLSQGRHTIFVRGKDAGGSWGPVSAAFLSVTWAPDSWIAGTVRAAGTAQPIAGATVVLSNTARTTGPTGSYLFPVYAGTYTLTASAPAYFPSVVTGVQATHGLTSTQDITLTAVPTGTLHGFVREAVTNLPLVADLRLRSGNAAYEARTDSATGYYSVVAMQGVYTVTVRAGSHTPGMEYPVTVAPGSLVQLDFTLPVTRCVLLVDDDGGRNYETFFQAALDQAGIPYNSWTVATGGAPPAATLAANPAVLWFTGDDPTTSTLSVTDRSRLTSYLQAGGNLLLTGNDIGANNQAYTFYRQILASQYLAKSSGVNTIVAGPPFTVGPLTLNGGDGAGDAASPDSLSPRLAATPAFTYTNGMGAGVAYDAGGYRSLNLGFGIEGISTAADRRMVVRDGLSWLGCRPVPVDLRLGLAATSDPVKPGDLLTYTLSLENHSLIPLSGIAITDVLPAGVDFVSAAPAASLGGRTVRWEGLTLPPGGSTTLSLVTRVRINAAGSIIRNVAYAARADQMLKPALGLQPADTPVGGSRVFLPVIIRQVTVKIR